LQQEEKEKEVYGDQLFDIQVEIYGLNIAFELPW